MPSGLAKTLFIICIVGAINWGLIGFFNWNLVDAIFGGGAHEETSGVSRFVYALVGLCGLAALATMLTQRMTLPAGRRTVTP